MSHYAWHGRLDHSLGKSPLYRGRVPHRPPVRPAGRQAGLADPQRAIVASHCFLLTLGLRWTLHNHHIHNKGCPPCVSPAPHGGTDGHKIRNRRIPRSHQSGEMRRIPRIFKERWVPRFGCGLAKRGGVGGLFYKINVRGWIDNLLFTDEIYDRRRGFCILSLRSSPPDPAPHRTERREGRKRTDDYVRQPPESRLFFWGCFFISKKR